MSSFGLLGIYIQKEKMLTEGGKYRVGFARNR